MAAQDSLDAGSDESDDGPIRLLEMRAQMAVQNSLDAGSDESDDGSDQMA